jgi:hypothetical protein
MSGEVKKELSEIGETLFCAKESWGGHLKATSLSFDEDNVLQIVGIGSNGDKVTTTTEHFIHQAILT